MTGRSSRRPNRKPQRRLYVDLTVEEYERLAAIAHRQDRSLAATCRLALRLLDEAERAKEEGAVTVPPSSPRGV